MRINENLLPKQGDDGKFVKYISPVVGEILKNYIGQKITISCDIESTHDDTEVLVYPYQNSGISIDNVQKSYTVGKTKKRIVDVRTVTQLPENLNTGQIMFYNRDTTKKIKVTNIKIELGTEATPWIPHRNDLTETQRTLMPEHLFGGGVSTGRRFQRYNLESGVGLC